MAKKNDKPLDSIFESTGNKKNAEKSKPAGKTAEAGGGAEDFVVDKFKVLNTLLKTHEQETLYRKTKEDRLFIVGLALITAVAVGAFMIRATSIDGVAGKWFYSLLFRTFFAVVTGAIGFTISAMVELNRTRLQDLLAIIVKIHESFHLFDDGAYAKDGGAYLPNTYKFIGSINDDETNYSVLVLKVGSVAAAIAVFLLV